MVMTELERPEQLLTDQLKVVHESVLWEEDDRRWNFMGKKPMPMDASQDIDMRNDAYIWCFTGTRGAGKSLAMTFYTMKAAYIYNTRIVSNFPIKFAIKRINGKTSYYEAEPLDLYKLLCFDEDYRHCLILIDEAPDVISHMASMTWKNRLLNIFVRQLRKNMNSLFLGAQQFSLIDKSMRWQTDILVQCKDAFRLYGSSGGLARGACILIDKYDNSGQWTGHGKFINYDGEVGMHEADESLEIPGKVIWGAYDTYYQQDVFDSLRRVDMKLGTYEVGDPKNKPDYSEYLDRALVAIEKVMNDGKKVKTVEFYDMIGEGTEKEVQWLSHKLQRAGVKGNAKREVKDFSGFDMGKFVRITGE